MQKDAEDAHEARRRAAIDPATRLVAVNALFFATIELPPSDRAEILEGKVAVARAGDRSDPTMAH